MIIRLGRIDFNVTAFADKRFSDFKNVCHYHGLKDEKTIKSYWAELKKHLPKKQERGE